MTAVHLAAAGTPAPSIANPLFGLAADFLSKINFSARNEEKVLSSERQNRRFWWQFTKVLDNLKWTTLDVRLPRQGVQDESSSF